MAWGYDGAGREGGEMVTVKGVNDTELQLGLRGYWVVLLYCLATAWYSMATGLVMVQGSEGAGW